jgi:acyl dehydratase
MNERAVAGAHGELQGLVGRRGPELRGTVSRRQIERYAVASGETAPRYRSEEAAHEAGYETLPSPPVMLPSVIEWGAGPPLEELRADGTGVGKEGWLPLAGLRLMGGGQDLVFHRPVLAGTEFVAQPHFEAVELKQGSSGPVLLLSITTEFHDLAGALLVSCRETLIAR